MSHRRFRDETGRVWDVWDVHPTDAECRDLASGLDRRSGDAVLTGGWLAFGGPDERRRLAPIPPAWAEAPVSQLRELLAQSVLARQTPSGQRAIPPESSASRAGGA